MKTLFILLLLPLQLISQDLSGIWTGLIHTKGNDLLYELVISENKEKSRGYSLTIFTVDGIENVGVKSVILKKKKGNISIEDDQLIYDNYSTKPKRVKLFSTLSLNVAGSVMTLSGKFHTRLVHYSSPENSYYTGTITLQKHKNFEETKLISQLNKLNLLNTLAFIPHDKETEKPAIVSTRLESQPEVVKKEEKVISISKTETPKNKYDALDPVFKESIPLASVKDPNRSLPPDKIETQTDSIFKHLTGKNIKPPEKKYIPRPAIETPVLNAAASIIERRTEVIRNVFFKSDSLVLSLYDNGIVDGDTVSLVLNGKIIIAKKGLTGNPLSVIVQITPDLGDSLLLTLYAENLGSIPPNTGLLIIQDGNERNEIRFEGTMQKSSAVILRRRH